MEREVDLVIIADVISAICCSDWCSHRHFDQWTSISNTRPLWLGSPVQYCSAASTSPGMYYSCPNIYRPFISQLYKVSEIAKLKMRGYW